LDAFLTAIRIDPIARVIEPFLGSRCFKLAFFDHKLVSQVRDHAAAGVAKPSSLPVYTGLRQPKDGTKRVMVFFRSPRHELDPLDVEILQRGFDATWAAIKTSGQYFDFESDEALEAALRRELIEIARFNGVSDPETLRDILLATMPPVTPAP
jgi:hypothetical protein